MDSTGETRNDRRSRSRSDRPVSLRTLNRVMAGAVIVCIAGMLLGTYFTFTGLPPVPERVETADGALSLPQRTSPPARRFFSSTI
jgi:hypothetical protein